MSLANDIHQLTKQARQASYALANLNSHSKNAILQAMAYHLRQQHAAILQANQHDIDKATAKQQTPALIDRLRLTPERIESMAIGLEQVAQLPDPVGETLGEFQHQNGLRICKVRTPIGVIAVVYEARPNVTADVAGLCLKTGNALILRGGSEAHQSNQAILQALLAGGREANLPEHAVQYVTSTDRQCIGLLASDIDNVDLIIPRGGHGLIHYVTDVAKVPVIKHYQGICHTYVDQAANIDMALAICMNAKCQRPGVCNAMETLLIHRDIAQQFLPLIATEFTQAGVELRGDKHACAIATSLTPATDADWSTEYLELILSIAIVDDINAAITHINHYGSHHSDAIVSDDSNAQQHFLSHVDSAAVYVNASTRFTDGSEFGMGAEIGISTDKLHARGPMGLTELTSYQYRIHGSGQVR